MKTIPCLLVASLGLAACSGKSADPPTPVAPQVAAASVPAAPAAPAVDPAKAEMTKRALALTQEQIAQSRDIASLGKLAEIYAEAKDTPHMTWTLEQLVRLLPNAGDLRIKLAKVYAGADDKTHTYDLLLKMINQGYAYDISKEPGFEKAQGTKVWDYILSSFDRNAKAFGEGKVAFDLPKGDTLFEAIAWDPKRKQLLAGSVRDGKLLLIDGKGQASDFIAPTAENGLWGIFGIAIDSVHDKLFVISNGVPHFRGFSADLVGKANLSEFTLSTGKFVRKYALPDDGHAHILSSIAADGKGRVYVADGVNEVIYRLDDGKLETMLGNPALSGIRGLTVTPDGKTMYFADTALGIFGVDLTKRAPFNLTYNPERLVLGGIEGLYWYQGTLVAIQGNMVPQRIIRLKLSADGHGIVSAQPIDAAQPAFEAPTTGTIAGDDLYFIANSQKSLYSDLGVLTDESALEPVQVFRSNLRFAWDQKGVDTTPGGSAPKAPLVTKAQVDEMLRTPPKGVVQPAPDAKPTEPAPAGH
ncbi:MAG: hypothetical protein ABI846_02760 [Rudaea sp.]